MSEVTEHFQRSHEDARMSAIKACPAWPLGEHEKFSAIYWGIMAARGFIPYVSWQPN